MASYLRGIADTLAQGLDTVTWSIAGTTVERKNWANIDVDAMSSPRIFVVPGNAQTALTWTAPAAPGTSAITGYTVEYTPSGAFKRRVIGRTREIKW